MRRFLVLVLAVAAAFAQQPARQYGRIESVKKSTVTSTKAWVANTPLEDEHTQYTIAVHIQDRVITGRYEVSETAAEPPQEWVPGSVVQCELDADMMYLRSATGSVRLRISGRKTAAAMTPLTPEEKKQISALDAPPQSLIGFSRKGEDKAAAPEPKEPAPVATAPTGVITVRSTPFLSEVFVDGASMGYTPAKVALGPGKHMFRVEKLGYKAWTKELTVTAGSELTLDATLERK